MEDLSLSEYVDLYLKEVDEAFPLLIKYLDYNITVAAYIINMHLQLISDDLLTEDIVYKAKFDYYETIRLTIEILSSLSEEYKKIFIDELNKGNIVFDSEAEYSGTYVEDDAVKIIVQTEEDISDVFKLVHEFIHYIHLNSCDKNMNTENFYVYSEMFAMAGELYTFFYLFKKNICSEDIKSYLKEYFFGLTEKADTVISNGIFLIVQKTNKELDFDLILKYIDDKYLPVEYKNLDQILDIIDEFLYHEEATYIFGFIFSYLIAKLMINSDENKDKFVRLLNSSGTVGSIKIMEEFDLLKITKDEKLLYDITFDFYDMLSAVLSKKEIDYQKKIGELW